MRHLNQLLCFLMFRERAFPWHHSTRVLTSSLYAVSLLLIRPTTVVSSASLMTELESCGATQSWVNREYRMGAEHTPLWGPSVEAQRS